MRYATTCAGARTMKSAAPGSESEGLLLYVECLMFLSHLVVHGLWLGVAIRRTCHSNYAVLHPNNVKNNYVMQHLWHAECRTDVGCLCETSVLLCRNCFKMPQAPDSYFR